MTEAHLPPRAGDFMTRHVHWIPPEMPLADIIRYFEEHELSNAPVVREENGRRLLIGFVSEGDCLEHLVNEVFYSFPYAPKTAETIMRRHPVCVSPETELFTLASVLVSHGYRHLPVVEEGEVLVGIISRRDVLFALDRYYRKEMQEKERRYQPPDLRELVQQRFLFSHRP